MKTMLMAVTMMMVGSACFGHGYDRYDRYGPRRDGIRYRGRGSQYRSAPRRGAVIERLPPGASRQIIRGEHYARVGDAVFRFDRYRGGWVVIR